VIVLEAGINLTTILIDIIGKIFENSPSTPIAPVRAKLYFAPVRIWKKIIAFI